MRGDVTPGWYPIERISAIVRLEWAFSMVHATRWMSEATGDASVVSMTPFTRQPLGTPVTVVSSLDLQRSLQLAPERCVLDPQLQWDHRDNACELRGPVLGVHLSARTGRGWIPSFLGRTRFDVTTVLIEAAHVDTSAFPGDVANGWQHLLGRHLAFVTRWPLRATDDGSAPVKAGPKVSTVGALSCRN